MPNSDLIDDLISGNWLDPATKSPVRLPFRSIVIAPSLAGREDTLVRTLDMGRSFAVVSDQTTHTVLGQRVERALAAVGRINSIKLPKHPHADIETAGRIRDAARREDALIAVGAGSINDLCKYASLMDNKPFAVFATAPSMNGYTSTSAAITIHGHKKSLPARGARGVFIDLSIFAASPKHMIRSGLGDSVCRATSQVDWLLSHRLRGTTYSETPFLLLAEDEAALFANAAGLTRGDLAAMESLARVLTLCGIGICLAGTSAPGSQAEHMISHYIDMMGKGASYAVIGRDTLHGEQIGVTTLTVATLQERLLNGERPILSPTTVNEAAIKEHFGEIAPDCLAEFNAKALSKSETEHVNDLIAANWNGWRDELQAILLNPIYLHRVLGEAGAPTRPSELGWPDDFYRGAVRWARCIRNRYTTLDVIDDWIGL